MPFVAVTTLSVSVVMGACASAQPTTGPRASGLAQLLAIPQVGAPAQAGSHASADEVNASNNPLNAHPAANLQNVYVPEYYRYPGPAGDPYTNDALLRGTLPIAESFVPAPQLIRLTAPISTRPDPDGGYTTGLGDVNIFDILLLGGSGSVELGVGPLLTMPTASEDELGTGKWQAGLAAVAIAKSADGLLGGLVQWQASFAGDDDRADVETLSVQPFVIVNLPEAWYLRSTATWLFDLENDSYYIPFGLGAGKVWKVGSTMMNTFVEPQWTRFHDDTAPQFQVYAGVNFTFGGGK